MLCCQTSCGNNQEVVEWFVENVEERGCVNDGHGNRSCDCEVVEDAA